MEGEGDQENHRKQQPQLQLRFVLVHGIGHGAWCWYRLVALLRAAGHSVTAVDLAASGIHPLRLDEVASFLGYSKPLLDVLASVQPHERAVLVGHSYGAASVALAMETFPERIHATVFIAGAMPSPTCNLAWIADKHPDVGQYLRFHPLENYMDSKVQIDQETHEFMLIMGKEYISSKLYQLSPSEDLALAGMLVRPASFFLQDAKDIVVTEGRYGAVRRVYVVCKEDMAMVEEFQRWVVEQSPGTEVKEIHGADHMVMLSKPKELCSLLLDVVAECCQ